MGLRRVDGLQVLRRLESSMKVIVHTRRTCRICGGAGLRPYLSFQGIPFTDGYVTEKTRGDEFTAELTICRCEDCGVTQTPQDVEITDYYRDYLYTVSSSSFARRFMQQLAARTKACFHLVPGDCVIEIGSGDGYQLRCFKDLEFKVLGFEPAASLVHDSEGMGVPVLQKLFTAETIAEIPPEFRPAQVILLTYTLDHLAEPLVVLNAIRRALDPERGVLVVEVHDLDKIMERREACLFEHEHTIYLNRRTMAAVLARAGFRLLDVDLVPESGRRGNSMLVAAALEGSPLAVSHGAALSLESDEPWELYAKFGGTVKASYARFRDYVRDGVYQGRTYAGYGAAGRGVISLAMAGLTVKEVRFLCDRNSALHGLYAPCSHVPIVPPDRLMEDPVDELIVFSFGYMEEIRAQLSDYIKRGGRLVSILDLLR